MLDLKKLDSLNQTAENIDDTFSKEISDQKDLNNMNSIKELVELVKNIDLFSYLSKDGRNISTLIADDKSTGEDESIVVYTDSWNENTSEISFNQFFIYYVQKANSATSSLESNIASLCSTLFDNSISKYVSSNFQTFLLLSKLNIQIDATNGPKVFTYDTNAGLDVEYYKNAVIDWGDENQYLPWVDGTYNWDRPKSK